MSLSQIRLALDDQGLRARITLAAEVSGRHFPNTESMLARVIAVETTDDAGGPLTIAGAYDYQWKAALKQMGDAPTVPARAEVTHRLAQVGINPAYITDGTIERAVAAVAQPTPSMG